MSCAHVCGTERKKGLKLPIDFLISMIEQHFKFSRGMNFSFVAAPFSVSLSEVCGVIIEAIKRGQNKKTDYSTIGKTSPLASGATTNSFVSKRKNELGCKTSLVAETHLECKEDFFYFDVLIKRRKK